MRAVVQRVSRAEVKEGNNLLGSIQQGLVILLAVRETDTEKEASSLAHKILNLRIFEDNDRKMNLSVRDIAGELLIISQFTLYGDCRKGNRPSFGNAATPQKAKDLYELFLQISRDSGVPVSSGRFQAMMEVSLVNQGPVTILLDTEKHF